ncbi:MAG: hypothetical protein ACXVCY_15065 [Pseudobdellovibrionaceae bacterium]
MKLKNILIFYFVSLCLLVDSERVLADESSLQEKQSLQEKNCEALKSNGSCSESDLKSLQQETLKLKKISCESQIKELNCDSFFEKHPQYLSEKLKCDSYQVCKMSLESSFLNGCERYGVHVKDDFMAGLNSEIQCLKDSNCMKKKAVHDLLYPFWLLLGEDLQTPLLKQGIASVHRDLQNIKYVGCLSPEAQAEMQCYLMVKYGGALVLGSTVVGRASILRMKMLEKQMIELAELNEARATNAVKDLAFQLYQSGKFRFLRNGKEYSINGNVLERNKSYTVLVYKGQVIIGDNYVGFTGTTAGSHVPLHVDIDKISHGGLNSEEFERISFQGQAGAIRINADGSVDVSGYHRKGVSEDAAKLISDSIREAAPNVNLRVTPDRLSSLPTK